MNDPLDPRGTVAAAASDCVHCGFCLPACPTYQLWGEEMDSPRGRIHLISQVLAGAPVTDSVVTHLDRCLGCMACMPACPSGVRYNELIEAARAWTDDAANPGERPPGSPRNAGPGAIADALPPGGGRPPPPNITSTAAGSPTDGVSQTDGATTSPSLPRVRASRSRRDRAMRAAIFATFPYPRRLRLLTGPLRAAQGAGLDRFMLGSRAVTRLAPELPAALRVAPRRRGRAASLPGRIPARGERRAVVGMLTGCVQQVFFPHVNNATARLLAAEGCDVIVPPGQGCCGALSVHTGRASEGADFARRTIETFERAGVDAIVVNSAGCGSAMKEYGVLLAGDGGWADRAAAVSARVRDLSEFLVNLYERADGPRAQRHELPVSAVYHDACHLAHAQRITGQPRELLRGIPGLELAEAGDGGTCCGSAGVYNLLQPEAAAELGKRKAAALRATGAGLIISANPGCSLQIAATMAADGGPAPAVAHIAEVLDASLRGLTLAALTRGR